MTKPNRSRWLLLLIPGVPLGLILAGYIAFLSNCTYVAVDGFYDYLKFDGASGEYHAASTSAPARCLLYVDFPGHGPIAVGEITEEMLKEKSTLLDQRANSDVREYIGFNSSFEFRSGKLIAVEIHGDEIPISNRPEGPWLKLPVEYADLHQVFGPPKRKVRTREERHYQFH